MAVRSCFVGATWALLVVTYGCGDGPCRGSEDRMVTAEELPCAEMTDESWASHPFPPLDEECFWLDFQGCSRYEFENPLGRVPLNIIGYLSFDQDGRFSTPGSGNSFIIDEVSESEIVIRNGQNADFYLRLAVE